MPQIKLVDENLKSPIGDYKLPPKGPSANRAITKIYIPKPEKPKVLGQNSPEYKQEEGLRAKIDQKIGKTGVFQKAKFGQSANKKSGNKSTRSNHSSGGSSVSRKCSIVS